jgi:hypothetical protein
VLGLLSVTLSACSSSHTGSSSVPQPRKASFSNPQPGNGGCTLVWGCPTQELCWDGSEPDPFSGGCPPAIPITGGPSKQPPPPCAISSSTTALTPLPRNRTTLGVGEGVSLSSADGTGWAVAGAGTLNSTSGGSVIFTANDTAGTAAVTASAQGCVATTLTFNVIAPTSLFFVAVNGIFHTQGLADIGMQADVYLQPDSVSFARLFYREQNASASASGIYSCLQGIGHNPNPTAVGASQDPSPGYGTLVAIDTIQDGTCQPIDQHGAGSLSFSIVRLQSKQRRHGVCVDDSPALRDRVDRQLDDQ